MYIREASVDDILRIVFQRLIKTGKRVEASKGKMREITCAVITLTNPRARLSRTESRSLLFSGLGELLWYLAGSDKLDFITYYIPKYPVETPGSKRVRSAYGPRLFPRAGSGQVSRLVNLLKARPTSRRAVISLYDQEDLDERHDEVPCTCTLQFLIRNNRLDLITHMRSNDAFLGLHGDIFAFTMLQEIVARAIGSEVGTYRHMVGSLHLYDKHRAEAEQFLSEDWQKNRMMPAMPLGNPFGAIREILKRERAIRTNGKFKKTVELGSYWEDITRLLLIHRATVKGRPQAIEKFSKAMASDSYQPFIQRRHRQAKKRAVQLAAQMELMNPGE